MSKLDKVAQRADKAARLAEMEAEGLATLVTRRLTSRHRPWVHGADGYTMQWDDISVYNPLAMAQEVKKQLAARGMTDVRVEHHTGDAALRITVADAQFDANALQPERGHRALRVHEAKAGHGGRG